MERMKKLFSAILIGALLGALIAPPADAALATKIILSVVTTETGSLDLGAPSFPVAQKYEYTFTSGTGANQADIQFTDNRTIAASGTDDLDLAGVLTNAFGGTVTFVRINAIVVCAKAANTNNVIVGGAAANQFLTWVGAATHTVTVRPGGCLVLVANDVTGYAVTAGTGDLLRVTNGGAGTSVSYDVILIGRSA